MVHIKKFLLIFLLCLLPSIAFIITTYPSIKVIYASITLPDINYNESNKRLIQKHYLKYGIYIPLNDIIDRYDKNIRLKLLMKKSCGKSDLYIWLPLKLRLPIIGSKVYEWCLKLK